MSVARHRGLFYWALFLTMFVFILLIAGGLVTSHEAGLAVPDWPLSYGQWMPPMVGNIFWEHGHRMIAAFVGLLTIVMAVLVQVKEKRTWLKKLAWAALAMVIIQGLFGGLTVLLMLPPPVSIIHACLGQTFFCVVIALAYYLSPLSVTGAVAASDPNAAKLKRVTLLTFIFIYIQLILGAAVRHTGHMHVALTHMAFALIVVVHIVLVTLRVNRFHSEIGAVAKPTYILLFLTLLQIFLGLGAFMYTLVVERESASPTLIEVAFTSAHQTIGALILGVMAIICLMVRPSPPEAD